VTGNRLQGTGIVLEASSSLSEFVLIATQNEIAMQPYFRHEVL